jgi:hypothetical protein
VSEKQAQANAGRYATCPYLPYLPYLPPYQPHQPYQPPPTLL